MERVGPLFELMRVAAGTEPEIAALLDDLSGKRLEGMRFFVEALARNGALRAGLDTDTAAETVWTLTSAEVHRLLTVDRGWPGDHYEAWLAVSLVALVLPPRALG